MSKTITIRLSEDEYKKIAVSAKNEHRPISNFITCVVINSIEESSYADAVEMAQIRSDAKLVKNLAKGHKDADNMKGKFVG